MTRIFRHFYGAALALAVIVPPLEAEEAAYAGLDPIAKGKAIAETAEARDSGFHDSTAELKMILRNKRGQESVRELRIMTLEEPASDTGDKSMVVFDRPRDVKGTALLTHSNILDEDNQWLLMPAINRVKRISSRNKSGSFMGSEFSYEDMAAPEVEKYHYVWLRDEACAALTCHVVERTPAYEYSGYTKTVVWIDTEAYRLQRTDFYDRRGDHFKTLTLSDYRLYLDKHWRAHALEMVNHKSGKSTSLSWSNMAFKTGLDKRDFTQAALKRKR